MLVDGTDGEIIKSSLNRDNDMMKLRHEMGAKIFRAWGEIAPAIGDDRHAGRSGDHAR